MTTKPLHLLALLILALAAACGRAGGEHRSAVNIDSTPPGKPVAAAPVRDCGTMPLKVSERGPEFRFRFYGNNAEGVVDSIVVRRDCAPVQTLKPGDNAIPPDYVVPRLSLQDLDFDGYADLEFLEGLSAGGNMAYEYWRYDPAAGRFTPLGAYNVLEVDSARRVLTNQNQCCGGMQWVYGTYRVENGKMVTLRQDEMTQGQELVASNRYVHIIRERRGGTLAVVRADTVSEVQAEQITFDAGLAEAQRRERSQRSP